MSLDQQTHSENSSSLTKKTVKTQASAPASVPQSVGWIAQYSRPIGVLLGALLLIVIGTVFISNQREAKAHAAREALYSAQQTYDLELKALTPAAQQALK